jgi:hypothetical protein
VQILKWTGIPQTLIRLGNPSNNTVSFGLLDYRMIWIGDKGRDIYSTWNLSEEDGKKLEVLYTNFEKHVKPKSNKIYSRYKFLSRVQKEADTFEEYLTDLRLLVKDCDYQDQDGMIRDAIVFGTKDHKGQRKIYKRGFRTHIRESYKLLLEHMNCQKRS